MATVTLVKRPRKTGFSYIIQYVDPETKQKKYHGSYRKWEEARQVRRDLEIQLEGGEIPAPRKQKAIKAGKTFGDISKLCKDEWKRRVKEGSLAQSSFNIYTAPLHTMHAMWGNKLIGTITEQDILDFRADLADRYSPSWSNRNLFTCKQVFKRAMEENVMRNNPTARIKNLSEKEHERTVFLTPEQVNNLLQIAGQGKTRHYMVLVILLAVEHGCSCQEILDLKVSHFDLDYDETGIIRFHRTKNDMTRHHRIMPRTREALVARLAHVEKMRKKRGIEVVDDYLVGRLDGTRRGNFRKAWKTICKACGLEDMHFHDNRHTYCTNIILAGGSLKAAAAMIGHQDPRMTNRYTNLEGIMDNPAQDLLITHYGKAGNMS